MLALGGQFRFAGGESPSRTGYDMTAAFALATAMGIPATAVAEFLPLIEAEAVAGMNSREGTDG